MSFSKSLIATMLASVSVWTGASCAQAPAPYDVTPQLVQAAQKEAKVVFYTSIDLKVAEKLAQGFQAKYPGIKVQVERSGAERNFQRINQEYGSKIYTADVVESSDAVHFVYFKNKGWLEPAVPSDVAQWPKDEKDPDGQYAAVRATLSVPAYNTTLVKKEDAPKSYKDLLDPKWKGKIVKSHPGYSGSTMTDTYVLSKTLGWDYFKKLGQQNIMQVQSSTVPPAKVAQGERAIEADGNEYVAFALKESGAPLEIIYPVEGSPLVVGNAGLLKKAPHPNAARLFYHYIFTLEAQQSNSDVGGLRSFHAGVKEKAGRKPLSEIKLLHSDPAALGKEVESIKKQYAMYFGT
ncbi:MAG TPA: extracellular solute-binding protein [Paralcaligenes sp.]|jgi:iron(III) transport system substrate-binding protein